MFKVLRIIARLNIGGPAIHTITLTSELNKRGFSDTLVCGKVNDSEGDMAYLAEEKGVKPIVIHNLGREISVLKDLKAFLKLVSIMYRERPDIVHTHTAKAGTLGRIAAICTGVPVRFHTFHGHVFDGYFSPRKAKAFLLIERFLALFTDRVITVSESVKNEIVNKLKVTDDSKCVIVPLGFDLDTFLKSGEKKGLFRKKIGTDDETLLIGIVGRLVPIKNHAMFLDVACKVKDRVKKMKIKFIIVGDGELKGQLKKRAADMGLEEEVLFTGWVEDLASVYADLDVVTLTSLNEGTPVSLIEAMACGKPVMATNVGGVRDLVKEEMNGLLVKSGDVGAFADKLISLLESPDRREHLGENGRRSVIDKYSKERLVGDIESLYRDLMRRKTRG